MSNKHCYISNFSQDWNFFKKEFEKFGEIRKIYVESSGLFAKVYFKDPHCCYQATNNFKNNLFGWKVTVQEDPYPDTSIKNNFNKKEPASYSESNSNMYDDMFVQTASIEYCNVHGRPVELLEDEESGETYVNLKDVEKAGFRIFNSSEFDCFKRLREDDRLEIIMEDFTSFMLTQAAEYLLRHSVTVIKHQDILDTINKCKNILGLDSAQDSRSHRRVINHSYENNNVSVRVNSQELGRDFSQNSRKQFKRGGAVSPRPKSQIGIANVPFTESIQQMRIPKKLPTNFVPTQRYSRNQRESISINDNFDRSRPQSRRQQYDNEDFGDNNFATQKQTGFKKQEQRQEYDNEDFGDNKYAGQKQTGFKKQEQRQQYDNEDFGDNKYSGPKQTGFKKEEQRQQYDNEDFGDNKYAEQKQTGFKNEEQRQQYDNEDFGDNKYAEQKQTGFKKEEQRQQYDNEDFGDNKYSGPKQTGFKKEEQRQQYDNEDFGDNIYAGQKQTGFKNEEQRPAADHDKFRDKESVEQKQNRPKRQDSRDSIASTSNTNQQKQSDNLSQSSDSSTSKIPPLIKRSGSADVIAKVKFEFDKTYNVQISHVEKENICWVQEIEDVKDLDDLLLAVDECASEIESVKNITKGKLVLAQYEEAWCRSRVIEESPLNVLFIDYGNKETVEAVKELPAKFRKLPAVANRLLISNCDLTLENDMKLKIKIKQKYPDDTYEVDLEQPSIPQIQAKNEIPPKNQEPIIHSEEKKSIVTSSKTSTPPQPTEKHFFNMPKPLTGIKNKDKVMIIGLVDNRFAVKTRECSQRSKNILEYIKNLDKSELMLTSVKEGQLVLCSKDGLPSLCRAVVKKKESPTTVSVSYLDFCGEDQLSIKSLRNVDEYLATEPTTLIFTPPLEVFENLTEKSAGFINDLLAKKEKANAVLTEDNDFDLQFEDGKFLSSTLLQLENSKQEEEKVLPSDPPHTSTPVTNKVTKTEESQIETTEISVVVSTKTEKAPSQKSEENGPITYNDMSFTKVDVGTTGTYICYTIIDLTEITVISMSDECLSYLTQVSSLEVDDDIPFEPEVGDMCLVSYQAAGEDEPTWYRAVSMDKEDEGFVLTMVDFGSQVTAQSKNIRRFPSYLKDIPILGILCSIGNVENTEKNLARVKELIPEIQEVEIVIKEFIEDELKYVVELPELANI